MACTADSQLLHSVGLTYTLSSDLGRATASIEVENLTVSYGPAPALLDVSFAVPAGKLVGVIGPNGSGKSTLIKAILGFLKPDLGEVRLFGEPAEFKPTGPLRGLGWESVWILCLGGQWQVTDRLSLRAGYSFNQNPIPDRLSMFNVLAPSIYQNVLNFGGSLRLTESLVGSLTYVHAFDHTISGPIIAPPGVPVPASRVAVSQTIDALVMGLSVLF